MEIINLTVPPFPYFVSAGSALYRPGDLHRSRSAIGVFDLIFVEYGELYLTDNDTDYDISSGDYLILNPAGKHYSKKAVSEQTMYHWLHFKHDWEYTISGEVQHLNRKSPSLYVATRSNLSIPVYDHLDEEKQRSFLNIHSALSSTLYDNYQHSLIPINQQWHSSLTSQQYLLQLLDILQVREKITQSARTAGNIMDYITQNYQNRINLDHLSKLFNFHPAHIVRVFKAEYGITPIAALNQTRLKRAEHLLLNTDKPILDIAEQTGFISPAYFSRAFKTYTGLSPRDYRNKRHSSDLRTESYTISK